MINYLKSECYRVLHARVIYGITVLLGVLAFLLNLLLYFFGGQYGIVSFSYSNLVAAPMVFGVMGLVTALILYEGGQRNGNLKNTVAGGVSRSKIFLVQCIVSMAVSTAIMILVLGIWVMSAEYLLEKRGPVQLSDLLAEVPAVYLIAAACLISGLLLLQLLGNTTAVILVWMTVWFVLPKILLYAGLRFEIFYPIAMWLPANFFDVVNGGHVNMQECITVWDTTEGMIRCVLSGAAGTLLFMLAGTALLRKRDLK